MHVWIWLAMFLAAQDAGFKTTATVGELMQHVIIPSSEVLFNAGIDGTPDAEAWKAIEANAIVLAEAGNLLLLPARSEGRQPWIDAAKSMIAAAEAALAAARSHDFDTFFDIAEEVVNACSSCHKVYLE